MKDVTLYGPDDKPIERQALTQEVAAPQLTGVRSIWRDAIGGDLTPARMARILRSAAEGDASDYLTLAEEMEERYWHYASVLGVRKRAVCGLSVTVEAAADDSKSQEIASAVRELTRKDTFPELLSDLLDGLAKGYSAVEILWDRTGPQWRPKRYEWRDPRFFTFDRVSGQELRLLDDADTFNGVPLPGYKFVVHRPRLKTGIPIRGGLARLAAIAYMASSYTLTDWLAFVEVYGMPIRIGKYGPDAQPEDLRVLKLAVANIGIDAAAILPDSMKIDFQETAKAQGGSGADVFKTLADWLNAQISKAVLGQVATTEGTAGKLGADTAQMEVREDIRDADAVALAGTVNRDLVKAFVDLNWGPQPAYPRVLIAEAKREDITALADALAKLVPLGLRVEASVVRDKMGLPDPPKGENVELLERPPAPPPVLPPPSAQDLPAGKAPPAANRRARAANQAGAVAEPAPDEVDGLVDEALEDWEPLLSPVVDPIQALADRSTTLAEFEAGLPGVLAEMDDSALIRSLATCAFKARGLGDGQDTP